MHSPNRYETQIRATIWPKSPIFFYLGCYFPDCKKYNTLLFAKDVNKLLQQSLLISMPNTMSKNVSDHIVEMLVAARVKRIYAVTGDSLNPLNDAVRRDGRLQWIHTVRDRVGAYYLNDIINS
jgi:hypothetical protein